MHIDAAHRRSAAARYRLTAGLLLAAGLSALVAPAAVRDDLILLRNRCMYYAAGRAPNDVNTVTLRHGLYAQSPFSPAGEIDLASSGFALGALPAAVECGVIASNTARAIATTAAGRVVELVAKSAAATNSAGWGAYGYAGMLYHYYVWADGGGEFTRPAGSQVEVSSVDTALLMWGLLVSAQYFGEPVMTNYLQARDRIAWSNWLDRVTPGHSNQFHMAYTTNTGLTGHWDWRSDETSLVCLFAAQSDTNLDARQLWNAWTRADVTYTSPAPDTLTFRCYASWNGDPFTDFQALAFLDTARFPADFNEVDWFANNAISYRGHVEFFRTERGYLDGMTYAYFFDGPNDGIGQPMSNGGTPLVKTACPVHSLAGGLPFYAADPESNELARALSHLVAANAATFFEWHGWPVAEVDALNPSHGVVDNRIVGQNISLMALAIDNYLTNRTQNIVLRDDRLVLTLNVIFPPRVSGLNLVGADTLQTDWKGVPFSRLHVQGAPDAAGIWSNQLTLAFDAGGLARTNIPAVAGRGFLRAGR